MSVVVDRIHAVNLLRSLLKQAGDLQHAADRGRPTREFRKRLVRSVRNLFEKLSGEKATEEEIESLLQAIGNI